MFVVTRESVSLNFVVVPSLSCLISLLQRASLSGQFSCCGKFVLLYFFVLTCEFFSSNFNTINQIGVSGGNMERSKIAPQSVRFTASPLAGRRASLAAKELGKERDCSQSIYSWSSCYC